jgi:hypothetical protein
MQETLPHALAAFLCPGRHNFFVSFMEQSFCFALSPGRCKVVKIGAGYVHKQSIFEPGSRRARMFCGFCFLISELRAANP